MGGTSVTPAIRRWASKAIGPGWIDVRHGGDVSVGPDARDPVAEELADEVPAGGGRKGEPGVAELLGEHFRLARLGVEAQHSTRVRLAEDQSARGVAGSRVRRGTRRAPRACRRGCGRASSARCPARSRFRTAIRPARGRCRAGSSSRSCRASSCRCADSARARAPREVTSSRPSFRRSSSRAWLMRASRRPVFRVGSSSYTAFAGRSATAYLPPPSGRRSKGCWSAGGRAAVTAPRRQRDRRGDRQEDKPTQEPIQQDCCLHSNLVVSVKRATLST